MRVTIGMLAVVLTAEAAGAQTFGVTNSGSTAYLISTNGGPAVANPGLTLERSKTYTFNVTAAAHPFYIKTQRVTGGGSLYSDGVTGQGATGSAVTFIVPANAPATLYYQCGNHSGMGGTITIVEPVSAPGDPIIPGVAFVGRPVPHPVRGNAAIPFGVPRSGMVDLVILDTQGRTVRRLVRERYPAGSFTVAWDSRDARGARLPGGLYFVRLRTPGEQASRPVVVTP